MVMHQPYISILNKRITGRVNCMSDLYRFNIHSTLTHSLNHSLSVCTINHT
jgi:hypothetical protein